MVFMTSADAKKTTESVDRVLVLISDIGPSELILNILKSIIEANLNPHVITYDLKDSRLIDHIFELGITCEEMKKSDRISSLVFMIRTIKHIRFNKYRIVYASGQHATFYGIFSSFVSRVPKRVFTRHHSDSNFHKYASSLRLFRGFVFDIVCNLLATEIVAVSKVVKDHMTKNEYVASHKVLIINNSVSERFLQTHRLFQTGNQIRIGVISRLTDLKGVKYVAEAFSHYFRENQNCQLSIVGEESDSAKDVRQVLSHLPQSSYQFITKLSDTKAFYSDIDLFIHVPIRETAEAFGLVYLEALFSGVHCIFTKSGIISADEDLSEFCKIVNFEDSNAILDEITIFATKDSDVEELPREIIERYSPERMKNLYKEIWLS